MSKILPKIKVYFIGQEFYWKSGSMMSSIYKVYGTGKDMTYERYDWGKMEIDLANGYAVEIIPAPESFKEIMQKKLEDLQKEANE